MLRKTIFFLLFCYLFGIELNAQRQTVEVYIEKYKTIAIKEMIRTGIPASIKLAQGILESGNGNSRLARKGNNHFGIKCHRDWLGKRIYKDDDARNECFRKYRSAVESFRDHSRFLANKKRYKRLFNLRKNDYKSWAKGLKKAGYATARKYDTKLISIIKKYNLDQYDKVTNIDNFIPSGNSITERTRYRNGVPYFIVTKDDNYMSIKKELGITAKRIARYNDIDNRRQLYIGEPIYIKKKKKRTPRRYPMHVASGKETLRHIAQRYAIRLSSILKNNGMTTNQVPYEGQIILLR